MKVALVFFGQPRFIHNPNPYESNKNFILDKYETDVYCHAWFSEKDSEYDFSCWSTLKECPVEKDSIEHIKKLYNPKKIQVDEPRKFEFSEDTFEILNEISKNIGKSHIFTKDTYSNVLSQSCSIERALRLIENKEQYDFIILSRYDNQIFEFPDLHRLSKKDMYVSHIHNRFPDMLIFFGPCLLESMCYYSNIEDIIKEHSSRFWEPSNECLKMFALVDFITKNNSESRLGSVKMIIKAVRDSNSIGI
ncbi:MAG: hypothetical protein HWN81_02070 [Candidatus Lokiarchaeota archaeon]|nr:hypothetical protein [Candidatus Lokiarchaeota archaeon]